MAVAGLEEKYDAVRQLIAVGKERGYLLYDEVNDSLPAEVHSSEEIDDLLTTFERNGIEIYEDAASAKAARAVEVSTESQAGPARVRLIFENGDIARMEADDRPRMVGHRIVPTRWQGRCCDYREMKGCRIPTRAVVSWLFACRE